MNPPSSTPPPANESEGVPFKLPLSTGGFFYHEGEQTQQIWSARLPGYQSGEIIATGVKPEHAAFLVHAVNAHAKLESENAELRRALEVCRDALSHADDDIREHLQVARFNLTGKTHTGEQLEIPNPPLLIHAHGIAQSMIVRAECKEALRQTYAALTEKEAK